MYNPTFEPGDLRGFTDSASHTPSGTLLPRQTSHPGGLPHPPECQASQFLRQGTLAGFEVVCQAGGTFLVQVIVLCSFNPSGWQNNPLLASHSPGLPSQLVCVGFVDWVFLVLWLGLGWTLWDKFVSLTLDILGSQTLIQTISGWDFDWVWVLYLSFFPPLPATFTTCHPAPTTFLLLLPYYCLLPTPFFTTTSSPHLHTCHLPHLPLPAAYHPFFPSPFPHPFLHTLIGSVGFFMPEPPSFPLLASSFKTIQFT